MTLTQRLLLIAAFACLALACSGGDDTAGGPLPQQFPGETYPGVRINVTGSVILTPEGCFLFESGGNRRLAIWPTGSRADGKSVILPDGVRVLAGDTVRVVAALMPVADLTGVPDGYWGNTLAFCAPDAENVVVFDEVAVGE